MTEAARWSRAADPSRRIGHAVEFHASIGSTNDRARSALAAGEREGLAVVADLQTAGRGRLGRSWLSPAGRNLAVSVALRPRLDAGRGGLLGFAAALATRDACAAATPGVELLVRWPNDVVTADQRKVAGLLVETTLDGDGLADAVIGIGINVNWHRAEMPAELQARAASLADLVGRELDRVALLSGLLDRLDAEVAALERGELPVARLREASALTGRHVTVDLGTSRLDGRVVGIADDGALEIEADGRRRSLNVGEVVSVRGLAVGVTA